MAESPDRSLSFAFMRSHPEQAARVLEALPPKEAAAAFERAPARLGAGVLGVMLPQSAARCIAALGDERALEILAPMGTMPTVAILRHVPGPRRQSLVAGLPTAAALASALLLGYREDTLGAWADPDFVTVASDARAGDALDRVRLAPTEHSHVFVTDGQRRLVGIVGVATLLAAPAAAPVATLMQRPAATLAAHAPLAATAAHPAWEHASSLPVVERGEQLVGVITRDALARAMRGATLQPAGTGPAAATLPALLARGYWQVLSGLLPYGLAVLPRVRKVEDSVDER